MDRKPTTIEFRIPAPAFFGAFVAFILGCPTLGLGWGIVISTMTFIFLAVVTAQVHRS